MDGPVIASAPGSQLSSASPSGTDDSGEMDNLVLELDVDDLHNHEEGNQEDSSNAGTTIECEETPLPETSDCIPNLNAENFLAKDVTLKEPTKTKVDDSIQLEVDNTKELEVGNTTELEIGNTVKFEVENNIKVEIKNTTNLSVDNSNESKIENCTKLDEDKTLSSNVETCSSELSSNSQCAKDTRTSMVEDYESIEKDLTDLLQDENESEEVIDTQEKSNLQPDSTMDVEQPDSASTSLNNKDVPQEKSKTEVALLNQEESSSLEIEAKDDSSLANRTIEGNGEEGIQNIDSCPTPHVSNAPELNVSNTHTENSSSTCLTESSSVKLNSEIVMVNGVDEDSTACKVIEEKKIVEDDVSRSVVCSDAMDYEADGSECGGRESGDSRGKTPDDEEYKIDSTKKVNKRLAENKMDSDAKKMKLNSSKKLNGVKKGLLEQSESIIEASSQKTSRQHEMPPKMSKEAVNSVLEESFIIAKDTKSVTHEIYKKARDDLFFSCIGDKRVLANVDGDMLEELVMMKAIELLGFGSSSKHIGDYSALAKKYRLLEDKHIQLCKKTNDLRKQIEDSKHIIRKLIEEKVSDKPWTQTAIPLRVTRSVGLQVCTIGSMNVNPHHSISNTTCHKDVERVKPSKSRTRPVVEPPSTPPVEPPPATSVQPPPTTSGQPPPTTSVQPPPTPPVQPPLTPSVPPVENKKDESVREKESSSVSECIDLTDNDDVPPKPAPATRPSPAPVPWQNQTPRKHTKHRPESSHRPIQPEGTKPNLSSSIKTPPLVPRNNLVKVNCLPKTPSLPAQGAKPVAKVQFHSMNGITNKHSSLNGNVTTLQDHLPPLPSCPSYPAGTKRPPRPTLRIGKHQNEGKPGIMLSWSFSDSEPVDMIKEYQLYAYQATDRPAGPQPWKKVGDIQALPLPMACFLTQFVEGHKYHFIVRAIGKDQTVGEFSLPGSIVLNNKALKTSSSNSSDKINSA